MLFPLSYGANNGFSGIRTRDLRQRHGGVLTNWTIKPVGKLVRAFIDTPPYQITLLRGYLYVHRLFIDVVAVRLNGSSGIRTRVSSVTG